MALFIGTVLLALPRVSLCYPELLDYLSTPLGCLHHPDAEDYLHYETYHSKLVTDDLSTTLLLASSDGRPVTRVCPGGNHTIQALFFSPSSSAGGGGPVAEERKALLTSSFGTTFLDDLVPATRPDRRCKNRIYLSQAGSICMGGAYLS